MEKYNSRKEVPLKYQWDLSDFFADEEAYNTQFQEVTQRINQLENYVGCTSDAFKLEEFLKLQIETLALCEELYVYAYLINDQEVGISQNIARKNNCENLQTRFINNTSFFAPELLKLPEESYEALFKENPNLALYRHDLDYIYREKAHILTESEEKIVAELVNAMDHFEDMSSTLLNGEHNYGKIKMPSGVTETIAPTNYRRLMKQSIRPIRRRIYNSYNKVISQYSMSSAHYLNSYIGMQNALAHIRHYSDSWSAKLFELNMPNSAYEKLVATTEKNIPSLWRYYDLKRKCLGLDKLYAYDMPLDMASSNKEYSIEEAQKIIREALKPLGNEYLTCYEKIITNRYIDYCQYKGKCSGGYSFAPLTKDSRILLSFNGDLDSLSTIAHEAGHNVHHQMVSQNNPLIYRDVSSLVSEVASLTNECLLSHYLVQNGKNKAEKLAGLANIMGVIVSNLFGAVREGKMEQDMYEYVFNGGMLTKGYLDDLTEESCRKYYGDSVQIDKFTKNSWVSRSHYYMHFYLYSYAICISVASYVADNIIKGNQEVLTRYLTFLKTGSDVWPIDAFKILGVDLTDSEVYQSAINYFDNLIDTFTEIYNS